MGLQDLSTYLTGALTVKRLLRLLLAINSHISGYLKSSWANIKKSKANTILFWSSVNS